MIFTIIVFLYNMEILKRNLKKKRPESKCVWCTMWFKQKLGEPQKEGNFLRYSLKASVSECWHSANWMSVLFSVCTALPNTFPVTLSTELCVMSLLSRSEPYLFHRFIKCPRFIKKVTKYAQLWWWVCDNTYMDTVYVQYEWELIITFKHLYLS